MQRHAGRICALLTAIQETFLARPGLVLTLPEVQARASADVVACEAILGTLVDTRVLTRTSDGRYARYMPRVGGLPDR